MALIHFASTTKGASMSDYSIPNLQNTQLINLKSKVLRGKKIIFALSIIHNMFRTDIVVN